MPVDVEKIIQFIKQGDQDNVQIHLDDYNTEYSQCFFFDVEEKERKKFRRNKVREFVPDSDSDLDSDENDQDLVLRRRLAAALIWFIRMRLQPGVLRVCLRTLRIISRDRKALAPLITDYAILTLARLGGISALPSWPEEEEAEWGSSHSDITPENETETHLDNNGSNAQHPTCFREGDDSVSVFAACAESLVCEGGVQINPVNVTSNGCSMACQKDLKMERGVSMLTAALEQCLEVRWGETHEVLTDLTAPPVSKDVTQRALEILKTLFNITFSVHRQEVDEEAADLYRHLAAVLRHCLLVPCEGEDRKEELQGHTVNVLSALPLQCLDVLLSVRVSEGSKESGGVNMDCVHTLLLFMEKRMDRVRKSALNCLLSL
ncbi:hypothetical protein cypCar_00012049 [Cyprinus carpio]|nr:hypothetical protein cypCar_00012049 [Cyprinus carpio]